jgi:osmotically-inducible protein OsmY
MAKAVQVQVLSRAPTIGESMRIFFFFILTLTLAVLSTGCKAISSTKPAPAEPKPALRAMGEGVKAGDVASEVISDQDIGVEIRRRLNDNPGESAGIIVEMDEGKVTLRGVAPNLAAAWRAEAAARSVKGVKEVVNQILVAGGAH